MVNLIRKELGKLLYENLTIPEYQRIYCWPEKNVHLLLNDIFMKEHSHPYHIGTIIIHQENDNWNIIDGQQRLVTLSLLLQELGDFTSPLLDAKFESKRANDFVAYNRYLIQNYIRHKAWTKEDKQARKTLVLEKISLDILLLSDESLDLAYTFFSAQNDKGKALSDYDLLKSHHLRFIPWEKQQIHIAQRWDSLLLNHEHDSGDRGVSIVVGFYLYCLRRWTMQYECNPFLNKAIKQEFEAAPYIESIPPFGEMFHYNEAIQGGSHFFAYVQHFIDRYESFKNTNAMRILNKTISCSGKFYHTEYDLDAQSYKQVGVEHRFSTHYWFGDLIAAHLFAYYIKFGDQYLAEALTCITRIISSLRYQTSKANQYKLLERAGEKGLLLSLNRATSPTFFLADASNMIAQLAPVTHYNKQGNDTIRDRYKKREIKLYERITPYYILDFSNLHIK